MATLADATDVKHRATLSTCCSDIPFVYQQNHLTYHISLVLSYRSYGTASGRNDNQCSDEFSNYPAIIMAATNPILQL